MTIGLIFFTLADSQVQPEFDLLGVWLVCCALVADAVIGNVQEKAMKEYKPSNSEMVRENRLKQSKYRMRRIQ